MGTVVPTVTQIHDYNPGITPSGLFWTIRVPDDAVNAPLGLGTAAFALPDVQLYDYVNLAHAFSGAPALGTAKASFEMHFDCPGTPVPVRDEANKFVGEFTQGTASIAWTATSSYFSFTSDEESTSRTTFAALGRESNGQFYS